MGVDNPAEFNGWYIADDEGRAVATPEAEVPLGLVIRERPRPHGDYHQPNTQVAPGGEYHTPFLYGKHTRSEIWPFGK